MAPSEGEIFIRVVTDASTLNELRQGLKQAKTDLSGAVLGSPEWKEAATRVNDFNKALKEANPNFAAYNAHLKQARTEKRLLTFAMVELLDGFTGLTKGISAISGATESQTKRTQELTTSLKEALGAGLGVKFAVGMLGESFSALAGPAGIVVALVTILGSFVGKLDEIKKKAKELMSLSNQTFGEQIESELAGASPAVIEKRLAQLKAQRPDEYTKTGIGILDQAASQPRNEELERLIAAYERYLVKLREHVALEKMRAENQKDADILDPAKQKEREAKAWEDINKSFQHRMELERMESNWRGGITGSTTIAGKTLTRSAFESDESFAARQATVLEVSTPKVEKATKQQTQLISSLANGFDAVGQSIEVQLIGKLHEATSIFQVFTNAVISGLVRIAAQMASQALFGGILKMLGVVTAPLTGGTSLAMQTVSQAGFDFATAGGAAARMGQGPRFSGSGYGANGPIVLETRIKGSDLVLVQAKAGISRNGRIM